MLANDKARTDAFIAGAGQSLMFPGAPLVHSQRPDTIKVLNIDVTHATISRSVAQNARRTRPPLRLRLFVDDRLNDVDAGYDQSAQLTIQRACTPSDASILSEAYVPDLVYIRLHVREEMSQRDYISTECLDGVRQSLSHRS